MLGVGAYRPRRMVTNAEISGRMGRTDEWIVARSGIRIRRFAAPDETLLFMAVAAAQDALAHAGVAAGEVDCVLLASMSNLVQTPPQAVLVAHELGAGAAAAIDLSGACAGFCHAVALGGDMIRAGSARYVLVVGAERMTDIIDPADAGVAFMFADGAGAVLLGPSDTPGIGPVVRWADGSCRDALRMSSGWDEFAVDPGLRPPVMRMDGRRVFRWVIEFVVPAALKAVDAAGISVDDLVAFVPHQANTRMIDLLADRLGLAPHVEVARDVVNSGNTSAASIPLALERLVASGRVSKGGPALLIGFGAGLNYAGQVVLLPPGREGEHAGRS